MFHMDSTLQTTNLILSDVYNALGNNYETAQFLL